nr:Lipid II flippase MurJ [Candidatus Anoxychlamydiales bacterium]
MSTDTSFSIARSFKSFFIGTFFSRISGLLRDILMAFFFGTSPHIAAFMVAYRFANLFRRLLGEASFQAGFVPHYENLRLEDKKKASIFYRDLFFSITFLLAIIILLTEMFLFSSSSLFKNNETINLTKIMLVGLVFICLYALNSSFLQCHQSYFLPSVAPAIFNVVWIGCAIFFRNVETEKFIFILAFFIVVAFFFQYLTTAFSSFRIVRQDLNLK